MKLPKMHFPKPLRGFMPLEDALQLELNADVRAWIEERIAAGDPGPMWFDGKECWTEAEEND